MKAWLKRRGVRVSRKRVQRLMRSMGLRAIYRRPSTSHRSPQHPVCPYLLRNARITRPNQVWAVGITCPPMARLSMAPRNWATGAPESCTTCPMTGGRRQVE